MASVVPVENEDENGIGEEDRPGVDVANNPSPPTSTDEALMAVADSSSPPASVDEALVAVGEPPLALPSTEEALIMAIVDPRAPSTYEALVDVGDPPPLSTDEALVDAGDPPAPATDEALVDVGDPPPLSTDEALVDAGDPPAPSTDEALVDVDADDFPLSLPSTEEAFMVIADPSSPPPHPCADEALMTVADLPSSPSMEAFTERLSATGGVVKSTVHEVKLLQDSSRQEAVISPPKREKKENPAPKTDPQEVQQEANIAFPFNREILENLFAVCPAKDLAKFRYVSKEWSEAAVKSWRKLALVAVVDYRGKPRREYFKKMLPLNTLITHMNDPMDGLKLNFECYNFQKYKLESWYMTNKNPNMVIFWGNVGPSITQLYLYDLRVENMDTMLEILYEKVPNITTLILEKIFVARDVLSTQAKNYSALPAHKKLSVLKVRKLRNFPVNWSEFFEHFPGIKSLESVSITDDTTLTAMLESINSIRVERDIVKLKSLTIIRADKRHRCVAERIPNGLKNMLFALRDVHLEEFNVKLGYKTRISDAKVILSTFAESLLKLTFHVDYKTLIEQHRFPYLIKFPVLEEMQLFQWCTPETNLHLLLKQMPNLRSLKVDGIRKIFSEPDSFYESALFDNEDEKGANLVFSPSLDELSLSTTVCRSSMTLMKVKYLATFVPNLTKLEFKMDDRIFRLVCKNYPNLIEMRVGGIDLTDAGVCGTTFPRVSNEKNENISDLKKLRVFLMQSFTHELTDVSVFDGFLKVPKLFTLQMSLPEGQISHVARQALEESINNLVIKRSPEGKKKGKQDGMAESCNLQESGDEVQHDVEEGDK